MIVRREVAHRILLLTSYYPPDINSGAHLFHDLAHELARRGHSVRVVTGYPRHYVTSRDLDPRYKRGLRMVEHQDGVEVIRLRRLPLPLDLPVVRGLDHLLQPVTFGGSVLFGGFSPDALIYYSPPVPLALVGFLARCIRGTRVVMNLQDIFPQYAVALGVLRNRVLISLLERVERFAYRTADAVVVHSDGNADWIVQQRGVPRRKVSVIQNFVSTADFGPPPAGLAERFRELVGARPGDFVISYAGAMGFSQDLDTLLNAAHLLREARQVRFVLVGTGVERDRLVEKAERMQLPNVQFLPMQPRDAYRGILHGSDACLVTLRKEVDTPVVPGKLSYIMAAGRPVIAMVPDRTDAFRVVEASGAGVITPPGDSERLCRAVRELSADRHRRERFGARGRAYALRELDVNAAAARYLEILSQVLGEAAHVPDGVNGDVCEGTTPSRALEGLAPRTASARTS